MKASRTDDLDCPPEIQGAIGQDGQEAILAVAVTLNQTLPNQSIQRPLYTPLNQLWIGTRILNRIVPL
jgi:hypothetical protein